MAKVRVYELARELKMESKVLVAKLKAEGFDVQSHQSSLTPGDIEKIRANLSNIAGEAAPVKKKRKVIVRRRKKADSDETEASSSDSASEETPAAASAIRRKASTSAKSGDDSTHDSKSSTSIAGKNAQKEASDSKEKDNYKKYADSFFKSASPAEEGAEQVPTTEPIAAKIEEEAPSEPKQESVAKPAAEKPAEPKKSKFVGATVVKRAPVSESSHSADSNAATTEDSRGTRVTSGVFNRGESDPGAAAGGPSDRGTGKVKAKGKSFEEEDTKEKKRPVPSNKKRKQLSTRDLIAATELEDDDLLATAAPEVAEIPIYKPKTIYTPSASMNRRASRRRKDQKSTQITTPRASLRIVKMGATITVGELARQLSVKAADLIKKLMAQGEMVTINQEIDFDTATLLASEYDFEVKDTSVDIKDIISPTDLDTVEETRLFERPPIVTVMGHVDHGKTSILDAIRETNIASGEAGGITQHIGAYTVEKNKKKIAFLDTPGHEAFSTMRSRGAKLTDIVVLVVAADDGVMPQTIESISHSKAAGVPIIVAVNKMDKPNVNLERIFTELASHGVQSEEWGGDHQFVKVSALQKTGIDELLEAILLQAEVLELQAVKDIPAEGLVIEAHLDVGKGPVSTIMIQNGTLNVGDTIVAGQEFGKLRAMYSHDGKKLQTAGPSTPVQIMGLSGVPVSGDPVNVVPDDKTAKEAIAWRKENAQQGAHKPATSLDDILSRIGSQESIEVPIIIKADTQGSIEAISEAIVKLNNNSKNITNNIIHKAVGGVTGSDVSLAATSGAVILGFHVRAGKAVEDEANNTGVSIQYYDIIYDMLDFVKSIMAGKLPPIKNENIQGHAEVKSPINVPKIGTVAGSAVLDGKITRYCQLRLIRDDVVIYDGKIKSLRRFKDDVKEVQSGYECGISIEGYNDIKTGDMIEAYLIEETPATLEF